MAEFKSDIDLMVSNAKKYNMKGSEVYEDAVKIQVGRYNSTYYFTY